MTPDRLAFLRAILDEPDDHVRRLVFADWLDEQSEPSDLDVATAEFIRLSCQRDSPRNRMPREAYAWLKTNWRRLVPSVAALIDESLPNQRAEIAGRVVTVAFNPVGMGGARILKLSLDCWRGFVCQAKFYYLPDHERLAAYVWQDQPLATGDLTDNFLELHHRRVQADEALRDLRPAWVLDYYRILPRAATVATRHDAVVPAAPNPVLAYFSDLNAEAARARALEDLRRLLTVSGRTAAGIDNAHFAHLSLPSLSNAR